jgi:hypothetical protein
MEQLEVNRRLAKCTDAAETLSKALDADIIFFNGDLRYASANEFIEECRKRKGRHKNVALITVTSGGNADASFRIARYLQRNYAKEGRIFSIITGQCKSAGTLIACGAHEIYMGDFGELGPLDVQISKRDELWEAASGLNVDEAVQALQDTAAKMFRDYLITIKSRYSSVTFRTAAEVSISLIDKLLGPITAQIDPKEIGENSRAMDITKNYAKRLDEVTDNFKSDKSIDFLVESYPDHAFVIDITEAQSIFRKVYPITNEMLAVEESLGTLGRSPLDWAASGIAYEVKFLSSDPGTKAASDKKGAELQPKLSVVEQTPDTPGAAR